MELGQLAALGLARHRYSPDNLLTGQPATTSVRDRLAGDSLALNRAVHPGGADAWQLEAASKRRSRKRKPRQRWRRVSVVSVKTPCHFTRSLVLKKTKVRLLREVKMTCDAAQIGQTRRMVLTFGSPLQQSSCQDKIDLGKTMERRAIGHRVQVEIELAHWSSVSFVQWILQVVMQRGHGAGVVR